MKYTQDHTEELFAELSKLNYAEKLRAIQFLAQTLIAEEEHLLDANREYKVWSPLGAGKAASILQSMLDEEQETNNG